MMTYPFTRSSLALAACATMTSLLPAQEAEREPAPVRSIQRAVSPAQAEQAKQARQARAVAAARKQAEDFGPASVRVVDVRDLVDTQGLVPPTDRQPMLAEIRGDRTVAQLATYCQRFAEPPLAPGEEVTSVGPAHLVMRANPASQASILAILTELRSRRNERVSVELRVFEVSEVNYARTLAKHLTGEFQTNADEPQKLVDAPRALLENTEATTKLLARLAEHADILNAPRILVQAGQRAQVESGKQIAYVRDFDVQVAQGAFIADPVIDTLFDGLSFETVAGPLPRNRLGVDLEIRNGSVQQPIPEFQTTIGVPKGDKKGTVTIQLPVSILHRLKATVALPDRGIAIFALPKFGDKGSEKRRVVTLQVQRVN